MSQRNFASITSFGKGPSKLAKERAALNQKESNRLYIGVMCFLGAFILCMFLNTPTKLARSVSFPVSGSSEALGGYYREIEDSPYAVLICPDAGVPSAVYRPVSDQTVGNGLTTLYFDYTGSGASAGTTVLNPSGEELSTGILAALSYLKETSGVSEDKLLVIAYGRSADALSGLLKQNALAPLCGALLIAPSQTDISDAGGTPVYLFTKEVPGFYLPYSLIAGKFINTTFSELIGKECKYPLYRYPFAPAALLLALIGLFFFIYGLRTGQEELPSAKTELSAEELAEQEKCLRIQDPAAFITNRLRLQLPALGIAAVVLLLLAALPFGFPLTAAALLLTAASGTVVWFLFYRKAGCAGLSGELPALLDRTSLSTSGCLKVLAFLVGLLYFAHSVLSSVLLRFSLTTNRGILYLLLLLLCSVGFGLLELEAEMLKKAGATVKQLAAFFVTVYAPLLLLFVLLLLLGRLTDALAIPCMALLFFTVVQPFGRYVRKELGSPLLDGLASGLMICFLVLPGVLLFKLF